MTIIRLPHTARRNQIAQVMNNLAIAGFGISPTLNLDFTDASMDLAGRGITFTRASSATRVNASGLIELVGNDVARRDYDPVGLYNRGLLIEESRTNLSVYSDQLDNVAGWSLSALTVSPNQIVAPDGSITSDKILETAAFGQHAIFNACTVTANTTYTASIYLKAAERTRAFVYIINSTFSSGWQVAVDLTNGSLLQQNGFGTATNGNYSITNAGNGWWRVSATATVDAPGTIDRIVVYTIDTGVNTSYLGDITKGLYVWGAQLELGSFPTSYIPTTSAAVTRAADVASMTGTNFSNWFNATEGTFVVSYDKQVHGAAPGYNPTVFAADIYGDGTNRISLVGGDGSPIQQRFDILVAGVTQASIVLTNNTSGSIMKSAVAYKLNDFSAASLGALGTPDVSGTFPSCTALWLGCLENGSFMGSGHIQRLTYYNKRLPDATLQALSA